MRPSSKAPTAFAGPEAARRCELSLHRVRHLCRWGKLEGLGFFLDGTMQVNTYDEKSHQRTAAGRASSRPTRTLKSSCSTPRRFASWGRRAISASRMVGSGRAGQDIDEPWNALSSADKVRHVNQLIEREVTKATLEIVTALK